jgi:hypothetical protein
LGGAFLCLFARFLRSVLSLNLAGRLEKLKCLKINAANARPSLVVTMSYLPPPVGNFLLADACQPIHPPPNPHAPAFLLAPLCFQAKTVFVLSIDAYGALVIILYHALERTRPSPLALSKSVKPRPTSWTPRFFNKHLYTHTHLALHFVFLRASCQPFPPLDEIISVRAHPTSLASSISSFLSQRGHTHPSWDTPLSTAACPASRLPFLGSCRVIPFTQPSGPRRRPRGVMLFLCA